MGFFHVCALRLPLRFASARSHVRSSECQRSGRLGSSPSPPPWGSCLGHLPCEGSDPRLPVDATDVATQKPEVVSHLGLMDGSIERANHRGSA
jgi:hypothetical protein